MKFKKFIKECHEKEVFKMLSIYLVSSWLLLQVLAVTWEPLGLPKKSVTYLIVMLLISFPIYIFLLWKFRFSVIEKNKFNESDEKVLKSGKSSFQKVFFSALTVIATLCAVTVFLIVNNNLVAKNTDTVPTYVENDKIAVLKFGNNTGDPKYDVISKMASDWIIHGITENKVAQVISQDIIAQYGEMRQNQNTEENEASLVRKYLKPGKIVSGNFYLNNDELVFQSTITNGKTDEAIISFKSTKCVLDNPLDCIDDISELITGFLVTEGHNKEMLQETPPKYEAYKKFLEAKYSDTNEEYINLLNQSITNDPNYFEPKVLRVAYYYNEGEYHKADSLLRAIKPDSRNNKRQVNLLNMYDALLAGNNKTAYLSQLKEYQIAPFDIKSNKSAMVLALQFVNRPNKVEAIFNEISTDSVNLQNCLDCVERIYVKALSDIELKKFDNALKILNSALDNNDFDLLKKPLITALIRSSQDDLMAKFFMKEEIKSNPLNLQDLLITAGKEYLLKRNEIASKKYFDKAISLGLQDDEKFKLAEAYFFNKDFDSAVKILSELYAENPKDVKILGMLLLANYKTGNSKKESENIKILNTLRGDYQYGSIDYVLGQYYALKENQEKMFYHLMKAVAAGELYTSQNFQNDPLLLKYTNTKKFKEILSFWH